MHPVPVLLGAASLLRKTTYDVVTLDSVLAQMRFMSDYMPRNTRYVRPGFSECLDICERLRYSSVASSNKAGRAKAGKLSTLTTDPVARPGAMCRIIGLVDTKVLPGDRVYILQLRVSDTDVARNLAHHDPAKRFLPPEFHLLADGGKA